MDSVGEGTIAIILGAAAFPNCPDLKGGEAFGASALALEACLGSQFGADWKRSHLLNLFNSEDVPRLQLRSMREFCTAHAESQRLLIYYVGHGGFFGGQNYYLALHATEKGDEPFTGLEIRNLALVLDQCFPGRRVVLILDCCFAAEAMAQFQDAGAVSRAVETETFNAFPASGTSLLCASSKDDMAVWRGTGGRTMFSDCLADVLASGIPGKGVSLNLREIGEAVEILIRKRFGHKGVRPEVHSPRQRGADVATEPLFRNVAYRPPEPKRLPAEITDVLRNPIPQVRIGGIAALSHLAEVADREGLALIRAELDGIAQSDDSFSVREAGRLALNKLTETNTLNAHGVERLDPVGEQGGTLAPDGRTSGDRSRSKTEDEGCERTRAEDGYKKKEEQQKRAAMKERGHAEATRVAQERSERERLGKPEQLGTPPQRTDMAEANAMGGWRRIMTFLFPVQKLRSDFKQLRDLQAEHRQALRNKPTLKNLLHWFFGDARSRRLNVRLMFNAWRVLLPILFLLMILTIVTGNK